MNLVLFTEEEITKPLPITDPRAEHVLRILRFGKGDSFDCGVINGQIGKAEIVAVGSDVIDLRIDLRSFPEKLYPVTLLCGLPRPQTVKKILREVTALGAYRIVFAATSKSEPAYALSGLWNRGEFRQSIIEGASQAFSTLLPSIDVIDSFKEAIASFSDTNKIALDNYEASIRLSKFEYSHEESVLAIGPERGWSGAERDALRNAGFTLASLGKRVLRSETACVSGLALVLSGMGII
jgi:16S rRNA (uracil1498-N3)-methyltransferase